MYMESPVVRARELRRHDLLEDAARHRVTASALEAGGTKRSSRNWLAWIDLMCRACANLARLLRAASRPVNPKRAVLADR